MARSEAKCFAVSRGEITGRVDVNYWRLTPLFLELFKQPRFPITAIGDMVDLVQYGCSSLATEQPVGVPIVRMNNLQADGWDFSELKYIELNEADLRRYRLEPGDLLFNRTNSKELVGKCDVFDEAGDWVFASYLIRVRLSAAKAIPRFASDFLSTRAGRLQIDRLSRQIIGMTNVNAEELKEIILPLPADMAVQASFVRAMDVARAERRAKLAAADALLAGLDDFVVAALKLKPSATDKRGVFAVTSGAIRARFDPHFYLPALVQNARMLAEAGAEPLGSFAAFSDEVWRPAEHSDASFRYIEIGGVNPRTGEAKADTIAVVDAPSRARMMVRRNDIIVSLTRPHHGSIAQITPELDGCVASNGFAVLRDVSERLNRDYLWCVLRTKMCLNQMLQRASGGNYPAITEQELARVLVPVPTIAVQETIAQEAHRRREEARGMRAVADAAWQAAKHRFEEELLGPIKS